MKKRKVLIISSISPDKSANLGLDIKDSLTAAGYEVHFLTRYKSDVPNTISLHQKSEPKPSPKSFGYKTSLFKKVFRRFFPKKKQQKTTENQYVMIHVDETRLPIPAKSITDRITETYDFAITLFWQGMLTTASLEPIYNKIKAPIFIMAVDMFPFTGGCFYFWNCRRFIDSACGMCPGLNSQKEVDPSRKSFLYKQQIYSRIECVFLGNRWMKSYIEKTPIVSGRPIREIPIVINENVFCIRDRESASKDLDLELSNDQFVIFTGAPSLHEKRKGFIHLVQAINAFADSLSHEERSNAMLLVAGNTKDDLQSYFNVPVRQLGFLDYQMLAKAYNLADVYVSPSIQDAGPSMVNQSIMSGTPVVAFDIGVAQELVITGKTGYLSKTGDAEDFAEGIRFIYRLSPEERNIMRHNCRELGESAFSFAAFADKIKRYDREFCSTDIH